MDVKNIIKKIEIFWDVTSCRLLNCYRLFEEVCYICPWSISA